MTVTGLDDFLVVVLSETWGVAPREVLSAVALSLGSLVRLALVLIAEENLEETDPCPP